MGTTAGAQAACWRQGAAAAPRVPAPTPRVHPVHTRASHTMPGPHLAPTRHPTRAPRQVAELADAAHGFVAADLAALCSEAALIALRRVVTAQPGGAPPVRCVTLADFAVAETRVRPSAMRELAFEVPKVGGALLGLPGDGRLPGLAAVRRPLLLACPVSTLRTSPGCALACPGQPNPALLSSQSLSHGEKAAAAPPAFCLARSPPHAHLFSWHARRCHGRTLAGWTR